MLNHSKRLPLCCVITTAFTSLESLENGHLWLRQTVEAGPEGVRPRVDRVAFRGLGNEVYPYPLYIFFWGGGEGKTDNIDKKKFSFLFCCYQLGHCLASNYVLRIIPQLVLSLL